MTSDIRTIERLVAVETRLDEAIGLLKESREHQQKTLGLVDAVQTVDRKTVNNEMAIKSVFTKIDPIIHSEPSVTVRLKLVEDHIIQSSTRFKVMAAIATVFSPVLTSLLVFYLTKA